MKFIQIFVFGVSNWLFHTHFSTLSSVHNSETPRLDREGLKTDIAASKFKMLWMWLALGFRYLHNHDLHNAISTGFVTHHRSHFALESRWRATAVVLNSSPIVFLESSVWRRHIRIFCNLLVGADCASQRLYSWITTSVQPCSTIFKSPRVVKEPKCEAPDGGWTQVVRAVWGRNSDLYTILDPNKIEDYLDTHIRVCKFNLFLGKDIFWTPTCQLPVS